MNILIGLTATAMIWMGAKPVGYLARIGPAPLRFQAASKGPEVTVALPPLSMCDPAPICDEHFGPPPPPAEPVAPPAPIQAAAPPPAPGSLVGPFIDLQALTPQMLIQFFNRGGTNQDYNVLIPYQFNPPPAPTIPPPPSKATYTVK